MYHSDFMSGDYLHKKTLVFYLKDQDEFVPKAWQTIGPVFMVRK